MKAIEALLRMSPKAQEALKSMSKEEKMASAMRSLEEMTKQTAKKRLELDDKYMKANFSK